MPLRVLAISHPAVAAAYRRKFELIAREPGVQLRLIVPEAWREGTRLERFDAQNGGEWAVALPVVWQDYYARYMYRRGFARQFDSFQPHVVHMEEEPFSLCAGQTLWTLRRRAPNARLIFRTSVGMRIRLKPIAAPLRNYNEDVLENGPRYVQWNISLYADDVLWVVPGSHVRRNTAEENAQLRADPRVPLPNAVQTHLQPGDGVVYILPILHWGSAYLAKQRRCIHGGFARFAQDRDQSFLPHLSPAARQAFERWTERTDRAFEHTEAALRAAMAGDARAYRTALDGIHPGRGPQGQMLFSIYLSKQAKYVLGTKRPEAVRWVDTERDYAAGAHPMTLHWGTRMADRFTTQEAKRMFEAFEPLDTALQAGTDQHTPGFQGAASSYRFDELPDFTLDHLYRSWRAD